MLTLRHGESPYFFILYKETYAQKVENQIITYLELL